MAGFPLSSGQRRTWRTLGGGGRAELRVALEGKVEPDTLAAALAALAAGDELLRLRVVADTGEEPRLRRGEKGLVLVRGEPPAGEGGFVAALREGRRELLLRAPALLADGPTLLLLAARLARALRGEAPVPPDTLPYGEAVSLLAEAVAAEEAEGEGNLFWRRYDVPDFRALGLPHAPRTRGGAPAPRGEILPMPAGVDRADVLTAWYAYLWRLLRAELPVVAGVLADGRPVEELRTVTGPLARYLPFHAELTPNLTFREARLLVQARLEEIEAWQEFFTYDRIRGGEDTPFPFLFETVTLPLALPAGRLTLRPEAPTVVAEPFELRLTYVARGEERFLRWEYDAARFAPEEMAALAAGFRAFLAAARHDPAVPLRRLPLVDRETYGRIVVGWNRTAAPYPRDRCIHHLIEDQVDRTPGKPAVHYEGRTLTYAELDRRANRLAHELQALGVGPERLVALFLERSPELPVAFLGVLKAGGAYVPLDPTYPADRLAFMLEDTGAEVVLTVSRLRERLPGTDARVLCLDTEGEKLAARPAARPRAAVKPEHLAYVIYTSGSTGTPKGVMITHGGLVISNQARMDYFRKPVGKFLLLSPFAFDSSVVGLYWTLLTGGTLILVPPERQEEPRRLGRILGEHGITHLLALPSFYALLLEHADPADLASLRCAIVAGEACPRRVVTLHTERVPGAGLYSEYGATETTVWASVTDCRRDRLPYVSLGRPINNATMYVLDPFLAPVPVGVPGEVHFGGPALARGYLNRPELTAACFLPDPFADRPGARLYRTGDLARILPTGEVEFLGRVDNQVKIRGFRVELEEIEAVLAGHPAVREAAVALRAVAESTAEGGEGARRLTAYVVSPGGVEPAALREFLAARLPDYMVPSLFVFLDALPKLPHGKVDRRALPAPRLAAAQGEYAAPRTPEEETLARIWAELLGVPRVGIHDNFFALGGDSILTIQVSARAAQAGLRLRPRDVFQHQTVAELARAAGRASAPAAPAGPATGTVPLTPIQRWFFAAGRRDAHHANMSLVLVPTEPLRPGPLRRALRALLDGHDALRLRFDLEGEEPTARIVPPGEEPLLETVDLEEVADEELAAAIAAAAAPVQAGLDLRRGPLLRALHLRLGRGRGERLVLVAHHLAVDGVSLRILAADLARAYRQARAAEAVRLPPGTTPWKVWAERLHAYARREELREEVERWEALPPLPAAVPRDRDAPEGANTFATEAEVTVALTPAETEQLLRELPRRHRTEIHHALLAALARTLAPWMGGEGVLLDVEGHGREEVFPGVDLSRTVGWFTVFYPVGLRARADEDPTATLRRAQATLREVPARGFHYLLLRHLGPPEARRRLAALPAREVNFNYLGRFDAEGGGVFRVAAERAGPEFAPTRPRSHLLEVVGAVVGGRLRFQWLYSRAFHREETVARLAGAYLEELRRLVRAARAEAVHLTPAEAPGFAWREEEVREIERAVAAAVPEGAAAVETFYPLTGTQEGLLFHSLVAAAGEPYFEAFLCTLHGPLDVEAFTEAWRRVAARYDVLRCLCLWEGLSRPVQVVLRRPRVEVDVEDWRTLPPRTAAERFQGLLREARRRGFRLDRAPLMGLYLRRVGEERYRFLWGFHHLVMDGWSMWLVLQEVFALYEGLRRGRPPSLKPVRPYRDYVAWLARQDLGRAEAFWRRRLEGFRRPTPLPFGREGGGDAAGEGQATAQVRLSREGTAALRALARRERLTLSTLVQGMWAVLLSRLTGEEDVVFGSTAAGRPAALPGVEEMVGCFINTLPVRARVERAAAAAPWLQAFQAAQVEALAFEFTPLYQIQNWSELRGGTPLFDTIFIFENYRKDLPLEAMGESVKVREVEWYESTNYPVRGLALPEAEMLLSLLYQPERFEPGGPERMVRHFRTLLDALARAPATPLGKLPLLTREERRALVGPLAGGAARFPVETTVHGRFAAAAARRPDAPAVSDGEESLGYRELDRRANRLAHRLRRFGVGRETRVALLAERKTATVVALLGILKAGGAYVPLDPAYPRERVALILEDAAPPVVLAPPEGAAQLPPGPWRVLPLAPPDLDTEPDTPPPEDAAPASLAYVIFTSGSTGRPKGVEVTHENVVRLFDATEPLFRFGPEDVWSLFHSFAFDFSVWELWGALFHGGRVVVVPYWVSRSPEAFYALLRREGVTVLSQTPSAFYQLMQVDEEEQAADLALRYVVFGGEALDPTRLAGWFARHGDERPRLVNMYGITETTVHVTCRPLTRADARRRESRIGRPLPDLTLHILDPEGEPVPVGVTGEIYVGGAGVARGYLGRPDLTAARFLPDPFADTPGARLYRTGDLGRRTADGDVVYLGRNDDQVQLRGFRIELGEVETHLAAHPAVAQGAVLLREDRPGEPRLVAYVVPRGAPPEVGELRRFLADRLPDYMVPGAYVFLESLPLTAHGKLDRRALPAPAAAAPAPRAAAAPPRSPLEEKLCRIWAEVLGREEIGIHENFFEAGGDSILTIQVVSRAKKAGIPLTPKLLFERQTVAGCAAALATTAAATARRRGSVGPAPLTPAEAWFFLAPPAEPGRAVERAYFEVPPGADPARLEAALGAALGEEESVRQRFLPTGASWRKELAPPGPGIPCLRVDLRGVAGEEVAAAVLTRGERLTESFSLATGPLVRAVHFDLGPERAGRLLVAAHRLVVDARSWELLGGRLRAAWSGAEPPKGGEEYRTWAERLGKAPPADEVEAWRALATAAPREGAVAPPAAPARNTRASAAVLVREFGAEGTRTLLAACEAARASLTELLLAACGRLVAATWGGAPLVLEVLEERPPGTEALAERLGFVATVYPLVLADPPGGDAAGLLRWAKEKRRGLPGRGERYALAAAADPRLGAFRPPVLLRVEPPPTPAPESAPFRRVWPPPGPAPRPPSLGRRRHVVAIALRHGGGTLRLEWTYSRNLHARDTVAGLLDALGAALTELAEAARTPAAAAFTPSDFAESGLTDEELRRLLAQLDREPGDG